ncbi:laminin subunit alpha-4 [Carcharodon carcharias]|uniref:laminin subunit alpha-4 n=1 Tax=Carcharodon carcharias TaxID=13397 RepID=UPI001B7E536A|nr:laminin subunit alpha-4 [Carcharodon carcharias]
MAWISPWLCAFSLSIFGLFYLATGSGESSGLSISTEDITTGKSTIPRDQHPLDIGNLYDEDCTKGFYSTDYGECLPCNCHGHSEQCLDYSGICTNCQNNTTGDHCEKCLDGYIGDVVQGHHKSCQPCPCPLSIPSNNFAVSCMIKADKLRCFCQENYAGSRCERCAPGYYGTPLLYGSSCRKCNCNGNSDPNLIFDDCNEETGYCRNCVRNTTGIHCERCAPGYYGDAVNAKNCTDCPCQKCGTNECDHVTGQCRCKPGVSGAFCDLCEIGYYGYSSCSGCLRCECALASKDEYCDPLSGQCRCLPGVTGKLCDHCLYGFWNYGLNGCQRCECEGHCDSETGECLSVPTEPPTDCSVVRCDKCIWDLVEDLKLSGSSLEEAKSSVLNVITGDAINNRLQQFNFTAIHFNTQIAEMRLHSESQKLKIEDIETEIINLIADLNMLSEKENITVFNAQLFDKETAKISDRANQINGQSITIVNLIQDIIEGLNKYGTEEEFSAEETNKLFREVNKMLDEMRNRNFSDQKPLVEEERTKAQILLDRVYGLQGVMMENNDSIHRIQDSITDYNTNVSDLKEALEGAIKIVQQTEEKNRENINGYQRKERLRKVLKKHFDAVNMTLQMANDGLIDTEIAISELENKIVNLSTFHASIDGAHKLLNEKLTNLSTYDKSLALRAIDFAKELHRLALELTNILKSTDANGIVQKAINASNVYDNIVQYVAEAEKNATTLLNAAQRAEDAVEGIQTQSTWLRNSSEGILNKVKELAEAMEDNDETAFHDTRSHVNAVISKKNNTLSRLLNAVNQLALIEPSSRNQVKQSKLIAEEAKDTAEMVLQTVSAMGELVKGWPQNLSISADDGTAFKRTVNSAGDTVENLTEIVPQLLDKLRIVEQKKPASNISASILRIRELIAQTRNVASKVQVSMKFDGQSAVEVNSKSNLEELKSFTSMSLYMQVPSGQTANQDRFIMYLGNKNGRQEYIGLSIKNDNLVYVYNLGNGDVEIPLNSKPVSTWPNYFNLIKIERVGRHGKIQLTVPSPGSTAEQKFIQKGAAEGNDSLLDLEADDMVFYVGGVPPDFQLPASLNIPGFVGCIELATLNDDIISLYNFKQIYKLNTTTDRPCTRYRLSFAQSRTANFFFDGSGYAFVRNIQRRGKFNIATRFNLDIRTPADSALLLLMVKGDMFFSMEMQNGYIRLVYDFGFSKGPVVLEDTDKRKRINDAKYHEVAFIYHNYKKMILLIDRINVKNVENEKKDMYFTDVYVGGAPAQVLSSLKSYIAVDAGFRGCLRSFQFQRRDFNILEEEETLGVSSGCPEESLMSRMAYFNGEGFISSSEKITPFSNFEGGFNFRTLQSNGLLFYYNEGPDIFSLSLDNGTVIFKMKETTIQSTKKQYNDGRNHFIRATVTPSGCMLMVDDKDKTKDDCPAEETVQPKGKFYFGGSLHDQYVNFTGCISNVYLSRTDKYIEVEDFQKYTEKVQASLHGCPAETLPAAIIHKHQKNIAKAKRGRGRKVDSDKAELIQVPAVHSPKIEGNNLQDDARCHLPNNPRTIQHAYQYGGIPNSRQEIYGFPEFFNRKSHFSVSVRTQSSHGLIFYVTNKEEDQFMTLFIARGHFIYSFSNGREKLKIKSIEKYNDGLWHNVIFTHENNKGRLIIDGLHILENSLRSPVYPWHVNEPFYVGGVPLGKAVKNIQIKSVQSFNGCLQNFQLNGQWISPAAQTFGVTPCFEGRTESGTYFSAEGGYVILDDSFNLGLQFELVFEVRARNHSGILLHIHSYNRKFLNLFMEYGQVSLKVSNGTAQFETSVTPKQSLCDGRWHRIAVIRDSNVVQLDVDSEVNHVVGPISSHSFKTKEPVFVGGVPESLLSPRLSMRQSFTGCMRNFNINETPVIFTKAALVSGGVRINSCPAV